MKNKSKSRKNFLQHNVENIISKCNKSTPNMKVYGAKFGKPNKIEK